MGPSFFSGAENTLGTKRQVQDKPIKAAEPVLLLQMKKGKHKRGKMTTGIICNLSIFADFADFIS